MNEAVTVKKGREKEDDGVRTLSTGVRARIVPVSQSILQDAIQLVREPPVPTWYNEEKERDEPNPMDPAYLEAMQDHEREQARVTFDVFALFGLELLDGLPEDDGWLGKLKLAEKLGRLDLSRFDLDDPVDREFLFKRYVAMSNKEYFAIGIASGINPKEVEAAANSFPGDEAREAD